MGLTIKRGDIVLVSFDPVKGSEQGKTRPALVIQNDVGNRHSPCTIVAAITSKLFPKTYPTNVPCTCKGLATASTILLNQIQTIDKSRIQKRLGSADCFTMDQVAVAIQESLGLQ